MYMAQIVCFTWSLYGAVVLYSRDILLSDCHDKSATTVGAMFQDSELGACGN